MQIYNNPKVGNCKLSKQQREKLDLISSQRGLKYFDALYIISVALQRYVVDYNDIYATEFETCKTALDKEHEFTFRNGERRLKV